MPIQIIFWGIFLIIIISILATLIIKDNTSATRWFLTIILLLLIGLAGYIIWKGWTPELILMMLGIKL